MTKLAEVLYSHGLMRQQTRNTRLTRGLPTEVIDTFTGESRTFGFRQEAADYLGINRNKFGKCMDKLILANDGEYVVLGSGGAVELNDRCRRTFVIVSSRVIGEFSSLTDAKNFAGLYSGDNYSKHKNEHGVIRKTDRSRDGTTVLFVSLPPKINETR